MARLFLSTQNNAPAGGRGELAALANGGVQLNALNQFISLNTTSGIANLAVETQHGGKQQRRGDLRLRAPERLGPAAQDEHPARAGTARPTALRCGGAAVLRPHRRRQGPTRFRRPGRAGRREAGREPVQDHERGGGAAGPGLPEALGGPVGRGEVPPEAGGKTREETG